MLIYPKNKKGEQKDLPIWTEDKFLRLRGFFDARAHKTDFKTEDGKSVLAGAFFDRIHRELEALEAAKLAQLTKSLAPKATALKAMPQPTGGSSGDAPRSTGAQRAAREAGERRARAASERKELIAAIRAELLDAEAELNEVYCRANASLVKYSKAGKFRVISDEEIPRFHPDFSARKFAENLGIDKEVFE